WDKAVQQLILGVMFLVDTPMTLDELQLALKERLSVALDAEKLRSLLGALSESTTVVCLPEGKYSISHSSAVEFAESVIESRKLETAVQEHFAQLARDCCPDLPIQQLWASFTTELLEPLIREMGARTYMLIAGTASALDESISFPAFIQRYAPEIQ